MFCMRSFKKSVSIFWMLKYLSKGSYANHAQLFGEKKKKEKKKNLDYITHCNKFFHENGKLTQFILQAFKLQQNHNSGGIGLKFP